MFDCVAHITKKIPKRMLEGKAREAFNSINDDLALWCPIGLFSRCYVLKCEIPFTSNWNIKFSYFDPLLLYTASASSILQDPLDLNLTIPNTSPFQASVLQQPLLNHTGPFNLDMSKEHGNSNFTCRLPHNSTDVTWRKGLWRFNKYKKWGFELSF